MSVNGSNSPDPVLVEQVKLTATMLNIIAAGCVVAGIITPLVGMVLGALSSALHVSARRRNAKPLIPLDAHHRNDFIGCPGDDPEMGKTRRSSQNTRITRPSR